MAQLKNFYHIMSGVYKECQSFYQDHSLSEEEIQIFTESFLESCKSKMQESKEQNRQDVIKHRILQLKLELEDLWDKCYFPVEMRAKFPEIHSANFSTTLLNTMMKEIKKAKMYYNENKILLDGIEKFNTLLEKINQLDNRAQNPLKYQNRGAQMLKDEKDKKIALKELLKAQKDLLHLSQNHHDKHGFNFLINGQKVSSFLEKNTKSAAGPKSTKKENKTRELKTCSAVKRKHTFDTPEQSKRPRPATELKKLSNNTCSQIRKPKAAKALISPESDCKKDE